MAIPAQLRAVEMLLDPKSMGLSDTAYASKVSGRCEIRRRIWSVKVGKCSGRLLSLRSDPGAARVVIVADSDFAGTSEKLFWPERDSCIIFARGRAQPDVDPRCSSKIGDM